MRRALWLDAVDQMLRPYLPPGLAAHARLANIRGDTLVFVVDSPVWHAKLRLAASALVDAARSIGLEVSSVIIKTTPDLLRPALPDGSSHTPMSATARAELAAALALLRPRPGDDASMGRPPGRKKRGT